MEDAVKKTKGKIIDYTKIAANFDLKIPGEHNIKNAQAAMVVAKILDIDEKEAIKSLNDFFGTWRRFECKGETKNGVLVYDDYGHHPTEIKATLKGARDFFGNKKSGASSSLIYIAGQNFFWKISAKVSAAPMKLFWPIFTPPGKKKTRT